MTTSHRLEHSRHYQGQKPGEALVNWLNAPKRNWLDAAKSSQPFVEQLLADARVVFGCLADFSSFRQFRVAERSEKLPGEFAESYERLNETLAKLTYAPKIDPHDFFDGSPVSRTLVTEEFPVDLLSLQINWILDLIHENAILKIRRCQQCSKWYFARFSHQDFCSKKCQGKHNAGTEAFKEKRRKYMRGYYHLKKSGKVK